MAWCNAKGMDASKVKPQVFPSIHTGGLRLVEWGGMEFNSALLEL
jgi:hypothetical protein